MLKASLQVYVSKNGRLLLRGRKLPYIEIPAKL
jgi:hypothetical protein